MTVARLLQEAARRDDCEVLDANGLPAVRSDLALPADLVELFSRCGGLVFAGWDIALSVAPLERFVSADLAVLGQESDDSLSPDWYVIAEESDSGGAERVVIDLNPLRLGRCYNAFWDRYANKGSTDIVATTFTEFLRQVLNFSGEDEEMFPYWLSDDFRPGGDAYD